MSCTRRKTRGSMVVDLSCFCDVPVVSSCGSGTTTFDQKKFSGRVSKSDVEMT